MNHMTSGASNDIERATEIAQRMVCEFGMSPLGPLMFRKNGGAWDADRTVSMSEETSRRVDEEVRAIAELEIGKLRTVAARRAREAGPIAERAHWLAIAGDFGRWVERRELPAPTKALDAPPGDPFGDP